MERCPSTGSRMLWKWAERKKKFTRRHLKSEKWPTPVPYWGWTLPTPFPFSSRTFHFSGAVRAAKLRGNCATGLAVALRSSLPRSTPQQHSRHPTRTRNSQLADASPCLGFLSPSLAQIGAHRCLPYRSSLRARPAMVMERALVRLLRTQALRASSSSALVQVRSPLPPSQLIDGSGRSRVARWQRVLWWWGLQRGVVGAQQVREYVASTPASGDFI